MPTNARDLARLADMAWEPLGPHAREKRLSAPGQQVMRLLELLPGFEEPEWCDKPHSAFVVEGEFAVAFADRIEPFRAGDAFVLGGGVSGRHKAVVREGPVTLLLIEPAT